MDITQQLIAWVPQPFTDRYLLYSVIYEYNKLQIIIVDYETETQKYIITFDKDIISYRMTDELFSMNAFSSQIIGESRWFLYKVNNSHYCAWIQKNMLNKTLLFHFVIRTIDEFVEIIASYEPKIEINTQLISS